MAAPRPAAQVSVWMIWQAPLSLVHVLSVRSLSFARFLLSSDKAVRARVTDTCTFQIYVSGRALQAQAVFLI